jgi:nucleotide-binding universal stress UspA family protein
MIHGMASPGVATRPLPWAWFAAGKMGERTIGKEQNMYQNIVLAYDGSRFSAGALRQGLELAKLCGAQLHVLGIAVRTGGMAIAESVGPDDVWGRGQKDLEKSVETAVQEIRDQHVSVLACIRQGDPAVEISRYAQEVAADLVVLGHAGKGLLMRWFQGSVGARLLNELPCSLLVATD